MSVDFTVSKGHCASRYDSVEYCTTSVVPGRSLGLPYGLFFFFARRNTLNMHLVRRLLMRRQERGYGGNGPRRIRLRALGGFLEGRMHGMVHHNGT